MSTRCSYPCTYVSIVNDMQCLYCMVVHLNEREREGGRGREREREREGGRGRERGREGEGEREGGRESICT